MFNDATDALQNCEPNNQWHIDDLKVGPAAQAEIDRLKAELADAEIAIETIYKSLLVECLEMLRELEWECSPHGDNIFSCSVCGNGKSGGHAPDCRLAAIIRKLKRAMQGQGVESEVEK